MLVAQIPSEALLAYTTLLALFSTGGNSYNSGRWGLYAAAILVCALTVLVGYFAQRHYGFDDAPSAPPPNISSAPAPVTAPAQRLRAPHRGLALRNRTISASRSGAVCAGDVNGRRDSGAKAPTP